MKQTLSQNIGTEGEIRMHNGTLQFVSESVVFPVPEETQQGIAKIMSLMNAVNIHESGEIHIEHVVTVFQRGTMELIRKNFFL